MAPATSPADREVAVALDDGRAAHVLFTGREHGDLHIDQPAEELSARRRALVPAPWTWLRQVHGDTVVQVDAPAHQAGAEADAAVTACSDAVLAVHTADCAPVALVAAHGAVAVVHAGWRGLLAGVVEQGVAALRRTGDGEIRAWLGPCIEAACYEFSEVDLEPVVARYGDAVRRRTTAGTAALDVPAGVEVALGRCGVPLDRSLWACTACDAGSFSHRARGERGRQAALAWIAEQ